jgi:hypothetical protein
MANLDATIGDVLDGKKALEAVPSVAQIRGWLPVNVRPFGEQSNSPSRIKEEYARNENVNNHAENIVLMAKTVGSKEDVEKAQSLLKRQQAAGELTPALQAERRDVESKLSGKFKEFTATGKGGPRRGAYQVRIEGLPPMSSFAKRREAGEPAEKLREEYKRITQQAIQEGRFKVTYIG